jgi:hypothetical protein
VGPIATSVRSRIGVVGSRHPKVRPRLASGAREVATAQKVSCLVAFLALRREGSQGIVDGSHWIVNVSDSGERLHVEPKKGNLGHRSAATENSPIPVLTDVVLRDE